MMLQHIKHFQQNKQPNRKISLFAQISRQIKHWQALSTSIQPLLPQPEQWQIVCYQSGILTIAGHNQVMVSQLNYLRSQYTLKLAQLDAFHDLQNIQAILLPFNHKTNETHTSLDTIDASSRELFALSASCVQDPALKRAFEKLSQPPILP